MGGEQVTEHSRTFPNIGGRGSRVDSANMQGESPPKGGISDVRPSRAPDPDLHELDTGEIDELDELDDDSQLALIWCCTHRRYESHYIPLDLIGSGAIVTRRKKLRSARP
jgi:hypothetical protein